MEKKIAIPVKENGILESHFGHTRLFVIYQIKDDKIESKEILTPPPHGPGVLPKWLREKEVTDVIVFTMGARASKILDHFNIKVHLGAPEISTDELVKGFLENSIEFSADLCHHDHHHEHHYEQHHNNQHHNHHHNFQYKNK